MLITPRPGRNSLCLACGSRHQPPVSRTPPGLIVGRPQLSAAHEPFRTVLVEQCSHEHTEIQGGLG